MFFFSFFSLSDTLTTLFTLVPDHTLTTFYTMVHVHMVATSSLHPIHSLFLFHFPFSHCLVHSCIFFWAFSPSDLHHYRIAKCVPRKISASTLEYALFNSQGEALLALLVGAMGRDPLRGVGNVQLKLHPEGTKNRIIGIILESQCVMYTGFKM